MEPRSITRSKSGRFRIQSRKMQASSIREEGGDHGVLRIVAIATAALVVLVLDAMAPAGLAVWLLQIVLVWIATLWPGRRHILCATAACATGAVLGLCLSPHAGSVSWVNIANLLTALGVMGAIAFARVRELAAKEARRKTAQELEKSQEAVRILRGLLPICAWCKKIRNEDGSWEQMEAYICNRSHAKFTHGVCNDCAAALHRELDESGPSHLPTNVAIKSAIE